MSHATPAMMYRGRDPFTFRTIASRLHQLATLLRKELRENRWFILSSLPILALVPLQYALGAYQNVYPGDGFGLIIILLAAFAGIISGLRDLAEPRQDFWRSRPIRPHTFAATRLIAALISWFVPAFPAFIAYAYICSLQTRPDAPHDPYTLALSYFLTANLPQIFFAFAAFGIAHLTATLTRSAVDAALLTLAILLGLWLLPVILPPLSFLSTLYTMQNAPITIHASSGPAMWNNGTDAVYVSAMGVGINCRMHFLVHTASMLLIAIAAGTLSCVALARNWHVPMNRKLTLWWLGICTVLLLAAAGLQIRSDLSSTQELLLPSPVTGKACLISQFIQTDHQLLAIAFDPTDRDPAAPRGDHPAYYAFPLHQSSDSWSVGNPISLGRARSANMFSAEERPCFWTSALSDRICTFDLLRTEGRDSKAVPALTTNRMTLREVSLAPEAAGHVVRETDLLPDVGPNGADLIGTVGTTMLLHPWQDSRTMIQYDLSSPTPSNQGRITASYVDVYFEMQSFDQTRAGNGIPREAYTLSLPNVSRLVPNERLDLALTLAGPYNRLAALSAGRLTLFDYDLIRTYRQIDLTPTLARFTPVGRYKFSAIESLMYSHQGSSAQGASGDWVFRIHWSGGLRLFHLTDSSIRLAGQFNRPADQLLAAHIAGNHLLVGGQRLYIISLPPPPAD